MRVNFGIDARLFLAGVQDMPAKKKAKKKITKKKAAASRKAVRKSAASGKKKTTKKKAAAKKKAVRKKPVRKKTAKKKAAVRKKTAKKKSTKKKTISKKAVTRKAPGKKAAAKKKSPRIKAPAGVKQPRTRANLDQPAMTKPYKRRSGEDYMNSAQVQHFRNILKNWMYELMEEVDRTVHHMQDEASNFPDPNDRATQEEEFALELRTRDRERKLIKKINEALQSLDSGDYGYCEICGVEIGVKRLEARPTATLCIDCKTLDEIKERQLG